MPVQPTPVQQPEQRLQQPIKHFVTLMQENHSFDNYFGTYPGADGIPQGTCMPVEPYQKDGRVRRAVPGDRPASRRLGPHGPIHKAQFAGGRMNGFISAFTGQRGVGDLAMGYYDDRDIPFYWNIADDYVLFDRAFTSARAEAFGTTSTGRPAVLATPGRRTNNKRLR